jgi:hypothetical protein
MAANTWHACRVPRGNNIAYGEKHPVGAGMQAIGRTRTHGKNDNPEESRAGWGRIGEEIFSSLST